MPRFSRIDSLQTAKTSTNLKKSLKKNNRRSRRKRSRHRYYKLLKYLRQKRSTDNLCESVAVFDIGMEWTPSVSENLPRDVADWHNKEQLAYWKSRALSLEYENRMLMIHLKHVYSTYVSEAAEELEEESKPGPYQRVKEEKVERGKEKEKVEPRLPEGKKRTEEAKRLYGEKNYAKIMGMETAMQLNYDRLCETNKAPYWPNIPINL